MLDCRLLDFLQNNFFSNFLSGDSNSLDPDLARHFVGPDLDPNCLQTFLADNSSR